MFAVLPMEEDEDGGAPATGDFGFARGGRAPVWKGGVMSMPVLQKHKNRHDETLRILHTLSIVWSSYRQFRRGEGASAASALSISQAWLVCHRSNHSQQ